MDQALMLRRDIYSRAVVGVHAGGHYAELTHRFLNQPWMI